MTELVIPVISSDDKSGTGGGVSMQLEPQDEHTAAHCIVQAPGDIPNHIFASISTANGDYPGGMLCSIGFSPNLVRAHGSERQALAAFIGPEAVEAIVRGGIPTEIKAREAQTAHWQSIVSMQVEENLAEHARRQAAGQTT